RLVRLHVAQAHLRPDRDLAGLDLLLGDHAGVLEPLLEHRDAGLEVGLVVLRRVVLGVLGDVAELPRDADPLGDLAATHGGEVLDLLLELLEALGGQNDFLQAWSSWRPSETRPAAEPSGGGGWYSDGGRSSTGRGYDARDVKANLRESWWIREDVV